MSLFGGAHASNSHLATDQATQRNTMQGAASAYSNYRVAQAQARQQALDNMMSLYAGPNAALAGISGGQGANLSQAGVSPFSSPGYFNVGRVAPYKFTSGAAAGRVGTGISMDTTGTLSDGTGTNNANGMSNGIGFAQFNPGQVNMNQNGIPRQPPPPQQNPFQFRPGGR